ncbi:MAG: FecR domain-containing protein [Cellvibrionaceae bacterium]|nr:FecR domain-containing protein [Cellvibrionaceae bacterium]
MTSPWNPSSQPSHTTLQEAAEWFAVLRTCGGDQEQFKRWQEWLAADEAHRNAWHYVETISQRFQPLQASDTRQPAAVTLQKLQQKKLSRRQFVNGTTSVAVMGLLGWFGIRSSPLPGALMAWTANYRTATGEIRDFTLSDGTRISLNTASALNADYQPTLRRLQLVRGEVLVDTGKDPRPLMVDTPQGRLRALGTRFTVRLMEGKTLLAVYEGAVEITTGTFRQIIQVGQQTVFSAAAMDAVNPAEATHQAWAQGILLAIDTPLAQLIDELGRYHTGHIGVSPEVADLHVLGGYPLNDLDKTLKMLQSSLPIKIERTMPWWITIEARENPGNKEK